MAVLDVRSAGDRSGAATKRSEMFSSCCSVSTSLLMQLARLSKLEVDLIFMILRAFQLRGFVFSSLSYPDASVTFPDCRFVRDIVGEASSCSDANSFLS